MVSKVLIVGCGDLGAEIARCLHSEKYEIYGVRYSDMPLADYIHTIQADVNKASSLTVIADIAPKFLIYCVAANSQTDDSYRAHYVDGLRNVLASLDHTNLQHVFFVSSTRVYGQQTDEILDEDSPTIPVDFGGERLLEAEGLLRNLNATVLRLSGIYGPGRTRMLQLAKNPDRWPAQNSWTNRIHRDDAAAFIAYLITHCEKPAPCYIVTDSKPVSQYEVLNWIAGRFGIGHKKDIEAVTEGKRLANRRMLATGFQLQYPDYQAGYTSLID